MSCAAAGAARRPAGRASAAPRCRRRAATGGIDRERPDLGAAQRAAVAAGADGFAEVAGQRADVGARRAVHVELGRLATRRRTPSSSMAWMVTARSGIATSSPAPEPPVRALAVDVHGAGRRRHLRDRRRGSRQRAASTASSSVVAAVSVSSPSGSSVVERDAEPHRRPVALVEPGQERREARRAARRARSAARSRTGRACRRGRACRPSTGRSAAIAPNELSRPPCRAAARRPWRQAPPARASRSIRPIELAGRGRSRSPRPGRARRRRRRARCATRRRRRPRERMRHLVARAVGRASRG